MTSIIYLSPFSLAVLGSKYCRGSVPQSPTLPYLSACYSASSYHLSATHFTFDSVDVRILILYYHAFESSPFT